MSDPPATERPCAILGEEVILPDPLEETGQRVRVVLSRSPLRVSIIVLFLVAVFVVGAAVTGLIEDFFAAWFRENAAHLLLQRTVSNGWLLLILVPGVAFLVVFLILAIRSYKRVGELSTNLEGKDEYVSRLLGVLDNQDRLLNVLRRDRVFHETRFEQLATDLREQVKREREVLPILDEALVFMIRFILNGREPPEKARRPLKNPLFFWDLYLNNAIGRPN